jgi:DNA-binding response OmpR family regulator
MPHAPLSPGAGWDYPAASPPPGNPPDTAPMNRRILVIEDQRDIAELIALHLRDLGHEVECVHDGVQGLEAARGGHHDLIVLDGMLPGRDGLDVLRALRLDRIDTPVLMLTARSGEIDRVLGLELGADDYLTKPFSIPELQARVKAILRRIERRPAPAANPDERLEFGELSIDTASREVRLRGRPVPLTAREFDLLLHFARNPGRAFTRMQLLDAVWGTTFEGYEHNVNTHINRLRGKIETDPADPRYVLTVRGVGYRFTDPRSAGPR